MADFATILLLLAVNLPLRLATGPVVSTSTGQVRGSTLDYFKVYQFLGIPYAKQKRFHAPEVYPSWTGIRNAIKFGAGCPQAPSPVFGVPDNEMSEDCLFLDVYTPSNVTASSGLTVMVWIHGGGFTSGAARHYPGIILANMFDIVLVAINYRLGVLGFFNVPRTDIKGNYGMLDQVMALKWVKENIVNFGGDPQKVTIFGESAGSTSVSLLAMSPLAKDLFKKAIMESGSAVTQWAHGYPDEEGPKKLAKLLKCPESPKFDLIKCIKDKPFKDIVSLQNNTSLYPLIRPNIDKHFLTDTPRNLLDKGDFHKIPVMMGTNVDEGAMFILYYQPYLPFNLSKGMTKSQLEYFIKYFLLQSETKESIKEAAVFEYSNNNCLETDCPLANRQLAVDMIGDYYFIAAVDYELRARSSNVYSYLFSYQGTSPFPLPSWIRTTHGSEVFYVFGHPFYPNSNFTDNDRKVSQMMMKSWVNFAKNGDPNHSDLGVFWPKFVTTGPNGTSYLSINLQPSVKNLYKPHKNAFWNSYIHKLRNEQSKKCEKNTTSSSRSVFQSNFIISMLFLCACANIFIY